MMIFEVYGCDMFPAMTDAGIEKLVSDFGFSPPYHSIEEPAVRALLPLLLEKDSTLRVCPRRYELS